tara:strand:+ start:2461 stop:3042 length:582 start_codon:yes stop_codon:yes gene_type:complete
MNLQVKNLDKFKIERRTRMLKSLGLKGLLVTNEQKATLSKLKSNMNPKSSVVPVRVLFVGDYLSSEDSEEGVLFGNIIKKGMNITHQQFATLDTSNFDFTDNQIDGVKLLNKLITEKIKLCSPIIIVCFGETISQLALNSNKSILSLRNNFFDLFNSKLICTLDLNSIVNDQSKKRLVWEDIKKVNKEVLDEK